MIPTHILNRKGPRSFKDLNPEVITYLNAGVIETANLMEWLAIDQLQLLDIVLEEIDRIDWKDSFFQALETLNKPTANSTTKILGQTFGQLTNDKNILKQLQEHTSDMVRSWACWAQSVHCDTIPELLKVMRPYAADTHFGVREVVIFVTKERLIENLDKAISILRDWISEADENIRRFAVETLRPVGVWVKKIQEFQEDPEKGKPILEPLKSDTSKYVRDAVANWLNDASKSQPDWVIQCCKQWKIDSPTKETAYIIKRALRTLNKK